MKKENGWVGGLRVARKIEDGSDGESGVPKVRLRVAIGGGDAAESESGSDGRGVVKVSGDGKNNGVVVRVISTLSNEFVVRLKINEPVRVEGNGPMEGPNNDPLASDNV